MNKLLNRIIKWCNQNAGFIGLLALLISIISGFNFKNLSLSFTKPFLDKVLIVLGYEIKLPFFSLLLLIGLGFIYAYRLKNRYAKKSINSNFLIGRWKNQWSSPQGVGSEDCEIKKNGKYYIMGEHWFDLRDIKYNQKTNQLSFMKTAVRPDDHRKVLNVLTIVNNDLLTGEEAGHEIKYTRQV